MTKRELMTLIMATFDKGEASKVIAFRSADSDMNKGRSAANRNPFLGRVDVRTEYCGYVFATNYSRSVANAAQRLGYDVTEEDVRANLKENWHKPYNDGEEGKWFVTDKRTESKVYLKLQRNEKNIAHKVTKTYYVDGHVATEAELEAIDAWMKSNKKILSSTQKEFGLTEETEQHFLAPQLDTIEYIQQGKRTLRPMDLLTEDVFAMAVAEA